MGKQIQIAQNPHDEKAALAHLQRKGAWLSLPRLFQTNRPKPAPAGELNDERQILFPAQAMPYILSHVRKRGPSEARGETAAQVKEFFVSPIAYAFIEWNRSVEHQGKVSKGRYYVNTGGDLDVTPAHKSLINRSMNALMAFIRSTSPVRVEYTLPIYVSPGLYDALTSGKVKATGDLLGRLVRNPSYRPS